MEATSFKRGNSEKKYIEGGRVNLGDHNGLLEPDVLIIKQLCFQELKNKKIKKITTQEHGETNDYKYNKTTSLLFL